METVSILINGKHCQVPAGTTVGQLRKQRPSDVGNDQVVRQEGPLSHGLNEDEAVKKGDHLYSIPKIVKGSDAGRLDTEVALLMQDAGKHKVKVGAKTIGDTRFHAVQVKKVAVPHEKFGVTCTDLLFLLPPEYPALPPIGCYLNYKWNTTDKHFTLRAHYGAPSLDAEGWYWYCARLAWKPGSRADNGHNLVTLFGSARHAINNDDV